MTWNEDPMKCRERFFAELDQDRVSLAELCRRFRVSRKAAYKWQERREAGEPLEDRSRARLTQQTVSPEVVREIVALRRRHPHWGPVTLLHLLKERSPKTAWPHASTIAEILKREGLVTPRRRRSRTEPSVTPFADIDRPSVTMCVDFKGNFLTRDGTRCYPLTMTDAFSRYLLCCDVLTKTDEAHVRPVFERIFRTYGLPDRIRSDNGPPFASVGLAGLSRLSVWWLKLGVLPERIAPGKPQQNGRHERMHLTLKTEALNPPARTLKDQQRIFNDFMERYNHVRPHRSLGMKRPADVYLPAARPFQEPPLHFEYPDAMQTRMIKESNGCMRWRDKEVFISDTLKAERIGLNQLDDRFWQIYVGPIHVAWFDGHELKLKRTPFGIRKPSNTPYRFENDLPD